MKKLALGYADTDQFSGLTPAEREAWNHPEPHSYHSFHVEKMSPEFYRWRDSRSAFFYIGTLAELSEELAGGLKMRRPDPAYQDHIATLRILSQSEVDDLLGDI